MIRHYLFRTLIFFAGVFLLFSLSCRKKENIDSSPEVHLSFSTDTVYFDTVFTTVGSVTKRLILYNQQPHKIKISNITLAGGQKSNFRININGNSGIGASDIEIPANDSLYIFVKVTVDPNNQNAPFVVSDSLEFLTNGNSQHVKLVAWGQNALFYKKANLSGTVIWDSLKAHVIYGSLRVDTNSTLIIMPGTKVYFHQNSGMNISSRASLKIMGTLNHPVRFQGDRLDPFYRDLPGQWNGIFLEKGSSAHEINYVIVKNGSLGIGIDAEEKTSQPMLILDNSIIENMTQEGLYAYGTSIRSTNCVIGNCGGAALRIEFGGEYDFRQLTVGNYWSASVRNVPSLYLSNYSYDTTGQKISNPLTNAYFGNCILVGSNDEEIEWDSLPGVPFEYSFDHALLKTKSKITNPVRFINCMVNKDPGFFDIQKMDYRIDSLSPVIKQGYQMGVPFDILGIERGTTPDLGAYQYN
ncbi:MAG: hypothetical protein PHF97_05910 [Bacteroidales bacterium]|nr:hypothetical protein [Bacteroidales bacterium]